MTAAPKRRHSSAARKNSSSLEATDKPFTMHLPCVFLQAAGMSHPGLRTQRPQRDPKKLIKYD